MGCLTHLRESGPYTELSSFIKSKSGGHKVFFVPSPGNWGDALINKGTLQFFLYFGIEFISLSRSEITEILGADKSCMVGETVIVGGGGGWCKTWSSTPDFVEFLAASVANIILLPTSLALPRALRENVHLYRRDNSLSLEAFPASKFCHDMAFFLDIAVLPSAEQLWRLHAFRSDLERSSSARDIAGSIDVSLLGNATHDVQPFFEIVNRFKEIHTDRLHVAIAGSLLQKKVHLYPGNYSKARDVWSASMRDYYPSVQFEDWH